GNVFRRCGVAKLYWSKIERSVFRENCVEVLECKGFVVVGRCISLKAAS
uniref:Uncharacterized protein n=1 Tax=Parascaris univalens TaxID=6257 RepID=A0A915AG16_PARUN